MSGDRGHAMVPLKPLPGSQLSADPWGCRDDGTVVAQDGHYVCVLGCPEEGLQEQDITNGRAIVALPQLLRALRRLISIRPENWDDGEDPELELAWESATDALAAAGVETDAEGQP